MRGFFNCSKTFENLILSQACVRITRNFSVQILIMSPAYQLYDFFVLVVGVLKRVEIEEDGADVPLPPGLKAGEALPHCGVTSKCDSNHFPVHIYSGKGNSEGPKICVSGK